jgi:hypothetical protein
MKWNLWLAAVAAITVYFAYSIPEYYRFQAPELAKINSAPPNVAFLIAIPYAVCSGVAVFLVAWILDKIL